MCLFKNTLGGGGEKKTDEKMSLDIFPRTSLCGVRTAAYWEQIGQDFIIVLNEPLGNARVSSNSSRAWQNMRK